MQRSSQEQFSRQSHKYGKGHILENIEDVKAALADIPLPEHARVLDVATGGGHTGLHLASLGHHAVLSDISGAMLQRAREAAAQRGLAVETHQHAAEELPYPDGSFDLVASRVAPHHFSDPEKFVAEAARVLKPGGHFLLIDGTVEDGQAEAEHWMHHLEILRDPSHHYFLTPGAWSILCERAGLAVEKTVLTPFKQPDLEWYFETAATPAANREKVLELIATAPKSAVDLFRVGREEGKIVWWWQRLTLIARKP